MNPVEIHPRPTAAGHPHAGPPHPQEVPSEELFDWQRIYRYIRFSLGSVLRRRWLFLLIAASMVGLAAAALKVLPKTYEVETRLLIQKNAVLAVRADANAWETPTRSAAETILARDNLHALIRQTNLLDEWFKRRAPIQRLKDWVDRKLKPPPTDDEMLGALTGLLEKQLTVWTTPDGTVTIRLQWPDPVMAYRLVDAAHQNYFETRHVAEVSTIAEQIAILEGHSAKLKAEVDRDVAELQRLRERTAAKGRASRPAAAAPLIPASESPDVINLRVMLEAKRRTIADLDEFRRRHLTERQTRLAELRAIYSETNPLVVDLRQGIEALQNDSPQLRALRQEEADLRRELAKHTDKVELAPMGAPAIPQELLMMDRYGDDPAVDYARTQLRFAAAQYSAMRERIATARLDLDTARAAFKHRYSVVVPPEIPRGPVKPKAGLVMVAALLAGLLLALFGTTVADLRSGVLLETWQIEEMLGPARAITIVEVRLP